MTAYFIRRLLLVIPTFIGITIMVFTITRFVPGGPIERIISDTRAMQTSQGGTQPLSEEQIQKLITSIGTYMIFELWRNLGPGLDYGLDLIDYHRHNHHYCHRTRSY